MYIETDSDTEPFYTVDKMAKDGVNQLIYFFSSPRDINYNKLKFPQHSMLIARHENSGSGACDGQIGFTVMQAKLDNGEADKYITPLAMMFLPSRAGMYLMFHKSTTLGQSMDGKEDYIAVVNFYHIW